MTSAPLLVVLACASISAVPFAQSASSPGVSGQSVIRGVASPAPADVLDALDVGRATMQDLLLPQLVVEPVRIPVRIVDGNHVLLLAPHSIRSADFNLLVQDASGTHTVAPTPDCTVRGVVEGMEGSIVAGSIYRGQLSAVLFLGDRQNLWGIQPLSEVMPGAPTVTHVVFDSGDNLDLPVRCGTDDIVHPVDPGQSGPAGGRGGPDAPRADKVCQIACDADVEFFNKNSSSTTLTTNDVTNVINAVDAIYLRDVGILYSLGTVIVRTSEPDPYTTSSSSSLLGQFQSEWNSNQGGVQRDVAHMFTGKNLSGGVIGIAFLGVVCNLGSAYGVSESRFTTNMTSRTGLTAHEIGHNWNAPHCDGASDCRIMCSGLGGCSGSLTSFGSGSINSITNKKNSVGCLSDPQPPSPPILFFANPGTLAAFQGGPLVLTGTNFSAASSVQIGQVGYPAPFGFTVDSDGQITVPNPRADSLGVKSVTVSNSAGTSNGVGLTYVATSPPALAVPGIGFGGTRYNWDYAAAPSDFAFLMIAVNNNSTVPLSGFSILFNSNTFIFSANAVQLDAAGIGQSSTVPPAGVLVGITIFSQALTFDDVTFVLAGVTNIPGTPFVF